MYSAVCFISLLVLNIMAGLIFTDYQWSNVGYSSLMLFCNYMFIKAVQWSKMKDAFKISLSFILPFIGLIEFVLAIVAAPTLSDDVPFMVILVLIVLQLLLFLTLSLVSKND